MHVLYIYTVESTVQNQTCKFRFTGPPSLVELRSSGGAGEWIGDKLGLFQLLSGGGEDHAQGPVYRQRHDTSDQHYYLYRWDIHCVAHTIVFSGR